MIPVWARAKLIRAAFLAGAVYQAGGSLSEVKRATDICLGESGAIPVVRDARKNRPVGGHRYADVSPWGISLVHSIKDVLGKPRIEQERVVTDLLDVRIAAKQLLPRIRTGAPFHAEQAVRDAVGIDGKILFEISAAVMKEVAVIAAAPMAIVLDGVTLVD